MTGTRPKSWALPPGGLFSFISTSSASHRVRQDTACLFHASTVTHEGWFTALATYCLTVFIRFRLRLRAKLNKAWPLCTLPYLCVPVLFRSPKVKIRTVFLSHLGYPLLNERVCATHVPFMHCIARRSLSFLYAVVKIINKIKNNKKSLFNRPQSSSSTRGMQ